MSKPRLPLAIGDTRPLTIGIPPLVARRIQMSTAEGRMMSVEFAGRVVLGPRSAVRFAGLQGGPIEIESLVGEVFLSLG
jgi:hypothetical protein